MFPGAGSILSRSSLSAKLFWLDRVVIVQALGNSRYRQEVSQTARNTAQKENFTGFISARTDAVSRAATAIEAETLIGQGM